MVKPEELANQIRTLCEQVDSKVSALKAMGFNAYVKRNDALDKLEFTATKVTQIKL